VKTISELKQKNTGGVVVNDELIRFIRLPMISFRANTNDEPHVEFEMI